VKFLFVCMLMFLKPLVGKDKTTTTFLGKLPSVYHSRKAGTKTSVEYMPLFAIILAVLNFLSYGVCVALYVYLKKLLCEERTFTE